MVKIGNNMFDMKKNNRRAILELLYSKGMMSRKDLSLLMGLTPASLTINTSEMIEESLLYEVKEDNESRGVGRKKKFIDINYNFKHIIGLSIDIHSFTLYLGGLDLKIKDSITQPCNPSREKELRTKIIRSIHLLLERHGLTLDNILALGVSLVGIVDKAKGISIRSWGILNKDYHIQRDLEDNLQVPVFLENNVRALAQAHQYLSYPDQTKNFIFLKFGNGIGSAFFLESAFYEGANFKAGELGHVILDQDSDIICRCGKKGCLETVASVWKLNELLDQELTYEQIMSAYEDKEPFITAYLEQAIVSISRALSNYIILFDPSQVVLYGFLFEEPWFCQRLVELIETYTTHKFDSKSIKLACNHLELEGAATLAIVVRTFIHEGGVIKK